MDSQELQKLEAGQLDKLDYDDVEIREVYSAPYHHVQPRYQQLFCQDGLKIMTTQQLLTWGDTLDEV